MVIKMSYIFNTNHNRTHYPGCRAVGMMKKEHEKPVEEPRGYLCKWCFEGGGHATKDLPTNLNGYIGEERCHDPRINDMLEKHGCPCGSHQGDIRMYPHTNGWKVLGRDGNWWIYFHCYQCGHDTSLAKVKG